VRRGRRGGSGLRGGGIGRDWCNEPNIVSLCAQASLATNH
jgi:hypothetical protein